MTKISDFPNLQKTPNIARYLLIRRSILHSVQSRTLLYCQAMPAVPWTQRAFLLPMSVLSMLPQQKQPFQPLAPSIPWQQAVAGQRAQRWQPCEVPHPDSRRMFITLVKRIGNILVTLTENTLTATLYCHQLQSSCKCFPENLAAAPARFHSCVRVLQETHD